MAELEYHEQIVEESKAFSYSPGAFGIQQRLFGMIMNKTDQSILQAMEDRLTPTSSSSISLTEYVRALFSGLAPSARRDDSSSRPGSLLLQVVLKLLEFLHEAKISASDHNVIDCMDFVVQEIDVIPQKSLPSVVEKIINHMENTNADDSLSSDEVLSLNLLPRCFSILMASSSSSDNVAVPDRNGIIFTSVFGPDYVHLCLKRIILSSSQCSKPVLAKITSMLRDIPLTDSDYMELIDSIFVQMKSVEPLDLPSLVYQLLLLASKQSKRIILLGILSFFSHCPHSSKTYPLAQKLLSGNNNNYKKKISAESFRQIEGTIILHISFAVKQNPSLGQEILFLVRGHVLPLRSFVVSVILSIARIQRFEEIALNLLKNAVMRTFQDSKLCKYSMCAPEELKKQCMDDVHILESSFIQTVRSTAFGWDHVIPSLVKFGFLLIESTIPGESYSSDRVIKHQEQACGCHYLGALILQISFEVHEMSRDEIIEQSKCRIIGLKPEQSSPIIRMVGQLVQKYPHLMIEHVARLKECLDYYTFLHPIAASSLIHNICPLFHLSPDLQGYTVLVLRKAMFGREVLTRMTALQGLFDLLVAERTSQAQKDCDSFLNFSSEASCSQQEPGYSRKSLSLLQEMKGLLCRCLLQQSKIREGVYRGLIKLALVDPITVDNVLNLLWSHFCRYYNTQDMDPILDVDRCVRIHNNNAIVEEPLDRLVFLIHNLLILQPHEQEGRQSFTETCYDFSLSQDHEMNRKSADSSFRDAFLNLRKKLRQSSLLELNIDNSKNFAPETTEGKLNLEKVHIFLGIYEVLIDAVINEVSNRENHLDEEAETELQQYMSVYDALEQIVQKNGSGCNSKSKPFDAVNQNISGKQFSGLAQNQVELRTPFLSITSASYLLQHVQKLDASEFNNNTSNISQSVDPQQNRMAYKYKLASLAVRTSLRHIKATTSNSNDPDHFLVGLRDLSGDWKMLGKSILDTLTFAVTVSSSAFSWPVEKKEKEKQGRGRKTTDETRDGLILILVRCLDEIFRLAVKSNCVMEILGCISADYCEERVIESTMLHNHDNSNIANEALKENNILHQFLLEKIQPILEQLLHRSQYREFEVLSGVLLCLGSILEPPKMKVHGLWAQSNSKSLKLTHNGVAKALTRLSVCLQPSPDDLILLQTLSEELVKVMGSDEEEAIEISEIYYSINSHTKNCIAGFLLQHVETNLTDIEWIISKLKLHPTIKTSDLSEESIVKKHYESSRLKSEAALHTRLEALVITLSNFAQMSPSGAVADHFLKVTMKIYKCLASAAKGYIAPKGFKQPIPSTIFQMLAERTCKRLTAPLYNFMAVMQREQQENCQGKGSVSKIKREVRTIPNLVFHIEDYERYLIQLSKLTKVNLLRHAKRSTARDFKILDNGKKCKQSSTDDVKTIEEGIAGGEVEVETLQSERGEESEEQGESHDESGSENGEDEEQERPTIRFRKPMEKRARKAIPQDSD